MKTDTQLQRDVGAELKWDPSVQAAGIGVEVKDGVVTLAGEVASFAEKWRAESAALRVAGVKAMSTTLTVHVSGLSQRSDADLAGAVENVLTWTSPLPNGGIQVMVEGGWVTLSGEVDWQFQKLAAADSVRSLMGVVGINNQISLRPALTAKAIKAETRAEIKAEIEAALKRSAIADAQAIRVAVEGHEVTLSGTVSSWSEKETAKHSAWGTPGVNSVVDSLALAG